MIRLVTSNGNIGTPGVRRTPEGFSFAINWEDPPGDLEAREFREFVAVLQMGAGVKPKEEVWLPGDDEVVEPEA